MDTLRKSIRLPWKSGKRYNVLEGKENTYFNTPKPNRRRHSIDGAQNIPQPNMTQEPKLQRNTSLTRSVRDAVGTLRQKFRSSTRQRKRLREEKPATSLRKTKKTTKSAGKTPTKIQYREVKMYSPFAIETPGKKTPRGIRTVTQTRAWKEQYETPTRLKREVESLTANMQALTALTPNTLQDKAARRKSPITNGSLRTRAIRNSSTPVRKTPRKQIHTFVY